MVQSRVDGVLVKVSEWRLSVLLGSGVNNGHSGIVELTSEFGTDRTGTWSSVSMVTSARISTNDDYSSAAKAVEVGAAIATMLNATLKSRSRLSQHECEELVETLMSEIVDGWHYSV